MVPHFRGSLFTDTCLSHPGGALLASTKAASQHCPQGPKDDLLLVNLLVPAQSLACNLQPWVLGLTVGL